MPCSHRFQVSLTRPLQPLRQASSHEDDRATYRHLPAFLGLSKLYLFDLSMLCTLTPFCAVIATLQPRYELDLLDADGEGMGWGWEWRI